MKFKDIQLNICTCSICDNKTFNNAIEKNFIICDNCHEEITNINVEEEKYIIYLDMIKELFLNKYII